MSRTYGVLVYPLKDVVYSTANNWEDHYAVGINPNTNEVYLIHTEGVGYVVDHNKPFRFNDYNLNSKWYTVLEILEMCDVNSPVDLADWIRTFGGRLESNFLIMWNALTTTKPRKLSEDDEEYAQNIRNQVMNAFYKKD